MKIRKIYILTVVSAAVLLLLNGSSCNRLPETEEISISLPAESVTRQNGSIAVNLVVGGQWSLQLDFPDQDVPWARLNRQSGVSVNDSYGIFLYYDKNTTEENRTLTLTLISGNRTAQVSLVQTASDIDSGGPSDGTGGGNISPDNPPVWMEMPRMDMNLDYYSHHFTMNGNKYRNYSFGWDADNMIAHWVAYPLCKMYTAPNVDRTEKWGYDPALDESQQPNMKKGLGGGYDRGHQCPSADRVCVLEANIQTFYYTNMTAQIGKSFNQSIWANLENKVRSIAERSDTTYVVTGCVPGTEYHSDNSGKRINVPKAYFKALLYYSKYNTVGRGGYSAAGYYLEHRKYGKEETYQDYIVSISELEKKTGIDFFANLPAKIGAQNAAAVESEDPSKINIWK